MRITNLLSVLIFLSLLAACNMPAGPTPASQLSDADAISTAVELTAAARLTEIAGSATATSTAAPTFTPMPTQCSPLVTSTVNANVRSGPGTAYDIVGALPQGQSATIVGRNDAYSWWYINFPSVGSYAWIAGSVVTTSCVPAVVQVVAAPPLPAVVVADSPSSEDSSDDSNDNADGGGSAGKPDLIISEFTITPATPVMGHNAHVRIGVYNQGNAATGGPYTVVWYGLSTFSNPSCSWTVDHSNAHGGRILECDFVFQSWYPLNKSSLVIVDPNDHVNESNEGNNQRTISPFGVAKP